MIKFKYTPDWVRKLRGWPPNPPIAGQGYLVQEVDITEDDVRMWKEEQSKANPQSGD